MLVLTRRPGEEVVIGENIRLTVVRVEGGKVRLGIAAPLSVRVRRTENYAGTPGGFVPGATQEKVGTTLMKTL